MEHSNGSATEDRWERPNAPLGTLIYRAGLLSKEKLEGALAEGARTGRRLGEVLLQKGWIDEKDLARLLAGQKALPFVSLRGRGFDEDVARLLPERVCRFHTAMADRVRGRTSSSSRSRIPATTRRSRTSRPSSTRPSGSSSRFRARSSARSTRSSETAPLRRARTVPPLLPLRSPRRRQAEASEDFGLRIAVAEPSAPGSPAARRPRSSTEARPDGRGCPSPRRPSAVPEVPAEAAEPAPADAAVPAESNPEIRIEHAQAPERPPDDLLARAPERLGPADRAKRGGPRERGLPSPTSVEPSERRGDAPGRGRGRGGARPGRGAAPELRPPSTRPRRASAPDRYKLVLELEGDEEVDFSSFASQEDAEQSARDFIARLARRDEWPLIGTRFIPPERIRSIEIRERQSFAGSASRARWAGPSRPAARRRPRIPSLATRASGAGSSTGRCVRRIGPSAAPSASRAARWPRGSASSRRPRPASPRRGRGRRPRARSSSSSPGPASPE